MYKYIIIDSAEDRARASALAVSYGFKELSSEFSDGTIIVAVREANLEEWVGCLWGMQATRHAFLDYLSIDRILVPQIAEQEQISIGMMNMLCNYMIRRGVSIFHSRIYCPDGVIFNPGAGFSTILDRDEADFLECSTIIATYTGGTVDAVPNSDRQG